MDDYFAILTDKERMIFSAIAEHAIGLDYKPKQGERKYVNQF